MISSPIQKKDNTNSIPYSQSPIANLSKRQKLIQSEAKKLILSENFITLLEDITSVIDKKGFQVQSLVHKLNSKDGLFRTLTTRLQLAEKANDPVLKRIASYLSKDLLRLNQEDTIKIVSLGDQRFYQDKLGSLTSKQIETLKEKLFEALNELKNLVQNNLSPSETPSNSQTRQPKMGASAIKQANVTPLAFFNKPAQQKKPPQMGISIHDRYNKEQESINLSSIDANQKKYIDSPTKEELKNLDSFMKKFDQDFKIFLSAQRSKSSINESRQESDLSLAHQSSNPNLSPTPPLCTRGVSRLS